MIELTEIDGFLVTTPAGAAELEQVSRKTIYKWMESGKIRYIQKPHKRLVDVASLSAKARGLL